MTDTRTAPEEMEKLLEAADELSKGGVVPSRPLRVALGKAFLAMVKEHKEMREWIELHSRHSIDSAVRGWLKDMLSRIPLRP